MVDTKTYTFPSSTTGEHQISAEVSIMTYNCNFNFGNHITEIKYQINGGSVITRTTNYTEALEENDVLKIISISTENNYAIDKIDILKTATSQNLGTFYSLPYTINMYAYEINIELSAIEGHNYVAYGDFENSQGVTALNLTIADTKYLYTESKVLKPASGSSQEFIEVGRTFQQNINISIDSCSISQGRVFDKIVISQEGESDITVTTLPYVYQVTSNINSIFLKVYDKSQTVNYTITATSGSNGSISPSGETSYEAGSDATYNITPNQNYRISDVLVDGVSQGAISTYTFTNIQANHTISATFEAITYKITATAGEHGMITPSGETTYNVGSNATYNITPNQNYRISDVLVDGVSQGAISTYTFTNIQANHTISATFEAITYKITATAGEHGMITPSGETTYNAGSNATYTITPDTNYNISDVLVDGVSQGAISTYTFTNIQANHTISVTFVYGKYSITAVQPQNGSISPSGTTEYNVGETATYTISANDGYVVSKIYVDGQEVQPD